MRIVACNAICVEILGLYGKLPIDHWISQDLSLVEMVCLLIIGLCVMIVKKVTNLQLPHVCVKE